MEEHESWNVLTESKFPEYVSKDVGVFASGILYKRLGKNEYMLNQRNRAADVNTKPVLFWLGTNTCDGHIISLLNASNPPFRDLLENSFQFYYASFLMPAEGAFAVNIWSIVEELPFILVVEGTVSTLFNGHTTVVGMENGEKITALSLVKRLGARAAHVIAVGTCACYGGPYAAHPNPTVALPLRKVLNGRKVIHIPGCPVNPGWIYETLMHLKKRETIKLDFLGRPKSLYGKTVHQLCERLPKYNESDFAQHPGEPGCMYLVGCKGPVTRADCPQRQWIDEQSGWPVGVNSPCIGCTTPEFPDGVSPFFKRQTDVIVASKIINLKNIKTGIYYVTAGGIGGHLAGHFLTGRISTRIVRDIKSFLKKNLFKKR